MIFEVAHHMGLVPLACLAIMGLAGARHGPEWWWLAGALGVSWLADTAAHWVDPWTVSTVYPLSQAALVGAVLLVREDATWFMLALTVAAFLALTFPSPDVLLRTAAWVGVAALVAARMEMGRLRTALLTTFGGGWLAWLGYTVDPGWTTWGVYQSVRAVGIGLFCWAAWRPPAVVRA